MTYAEAMIVAQAAGKIVTRPLHSQIQHGIGFVPDVGMLIGYMHDIHHPMGAYPALFLPNAGDYLATDWVVV